jgi:hypothetical protein
MNKMIPFRTQVKFFLENPETVDVSQFTGVFQRWIQQKALDSLLVDVADYRHVFQGPGIILIGHESDYAIESRDGRLGLLVTRKHQLEPDLVTQLQVSLRLALAAAQLLESDTAFTPPLKFRANEVEVRFADRLQLPNQPESFELVKDDLRAVFDSLYGTDSVTIAPVSQDTRHLFTVSVQAEGVQRIADLAQNLQPSLENS